MGIVRLLLAIFVIASHTSYGLFFDGRTSVIIFYMISGYLMTYVLNTSYIKSNWNFYKNRLLKIYIPYWAVCLLTIFYYNIWLGGTSVLSPSGLGLKIWSVLSNIFILTQDLGWIFAVTPDGEINYLPYGSAGIGHGLCNYAIVMPIFTVAMELYFYFLAPFFLRCRYKTFIFLFIGVAYTVIAHRTHHRDLVHIYHFFPATLVYFGLGATLCWLYKLEKDSFKNPMLYLLFLTCVIAVCLSSKVITNEHFLFTLLSIPVLFEISSLSKLDQFLGKFSYPIYLIHMPVVWALKARGLDWGKGLFYKTLWISLLIAIIIHFLIETPLEKWRRNIRKNALSNT